ncbi:Neurogenic locus notch 1 [Paramuricea clavata]|uniref:Neurogenic locus notch 1 n=1 Tax=Paramuricea clavata TaxID=317549 RepID=A0A6S7J026_PARCT|nr:Neurogenic locus notch 1 [Paramuricea clavata]
MRSFVNQLPGRKVVLVAAQDEPSLKMTNADYSIFDKLGGQTVILKDRFRSSYALVGYTGPGRPPWIKQEQRDRYKGPSKISTEIPFGEFPNIEVISEGCSDLIRSEGCGLAHIYIDGDQKAPQKRGHNFVVINALTGKFEGAQVFDTNGDSGASGKITNFINTIPNGRVVVVAVQDNGARTIGNALGELKKIGAREPIISEDRSSFALIGYKGAETPKWITQSQKKSKQGPSFASAFVPFGPSATVGEYIVTTHTGNVKDASTNAKVYIKFTGANGDSREVELSKAGSVPFQQGGTDAFRIHVGEIGDIRSLRIRQDNSKVNPSWFLAALSVKDVRVGKTYMYLVEQWLQDGNNNGGKQAVSTLAVTLNQPSSLLSNEIQHNLNKWCVTNIKNAGSNLIALFDRGKKVSKFKWRCYSPDALVAEQTAYDTAKKNPNYYTRQALAKVYLTATKAEDQALKSIEADKAEHGVVVEYFTDIPGLEVAKLTSNPKYPKAPDEVQKLQTFETPQDKGDHYGARLRTYFMPPASGKYTFYISSDDDSQLFISMTDSGTPVKLLELYHMATGYQQWDKDVKKQTSKEVELKFGTPYMLTALFKEHEGKDHVSVGVKYPSGDVEKPMTGKYLYIRLPATPKEDKPATKPATGSLPAGPGELKVQVVINWKVIPGSLAEIKAGAKDVAWGRDGQDRVYAIVNGKFEYVADARKIISISVGGSEVWAVDSKGNVLYREGITASEPKGTSWSVIDKIPLENDAAVQIDVSGKGRVCVVTKNHLILCRGGVNTLNPKGFGWHTKMGKLKQLSCGGLGCWGIGQTGTRVWFRVSLEQTSTSDVKWEMIKDAVLTTVKAGDDGSVWGINANGYLFERQGVSAATPQGKSWVRVALSKQFQDISIADGVLFGVANTGAIYQCK